MTVRRRGFLTLAGSAVGGLALYWLLFYVMGQYTGKARVPAYAMALPIIGMVIGAVELTSGMPFSSVDESWQRLPRWLRMLGALVLVPLLLWVIVAGFYYALTR